MVAEAVLGLIDVTCLALQLNQAWRLLPQRYHNARLIVASCLAPANSVPACEGVIGVTEVDAIFLRQMPAKDGACIDADSV